jgi:integrase
MTVYAPKTGTTRVVPIIPRLLTLFEEVRSVRQCEERVLSLTVNNLYRALHAAITAAGLEVWADLFQALRRSCETDFAMMGFPPHATALWLGHGIEVSAKHYLQVPAELYERAAGNPGRSALQNALQHGNARGRTKPLLALAPESARSGEVA